MAQIGSGEDPEQWGSEMKGTAPERGRRDPPRGGGPGKESEALVPGSGGLEGSQVAAEGLRGRDGQPGRARGSEHPLGPRGRSG